MKITLKNLNVAKKMSRAYQTMPYDHGLRHYIRVSFDVAQLFAAIAAKGAIAWKLSVYEWLPHVPVNVPHIVVLRPKSANV